MANGLSHSTYKHWCIDFSYEDQLSAKGYQPCAICQSHDQRQKGFLGVESVLCLIEDDAIFRIRHLVRDLLPTMCRQTMHKNIIPRGFLNYFSVHLKGFENLHPFLLLLFFPHTGPDVGIDDISSFP